MVDAYEKCKREDEEIESCFDVFTRQVIQWILKYYLED
jgi:hypothetical protein